MMYQNTKAFWTIQYRAYKEAIKSGTHFDIILVNNPYAIKFISGPTEQQKLVAVNSEPKVLKYINGASIQVQTRAVELDPSTIEYVKNPTEEMWIYALENKPSLLFKIPKPTWSMLLVVKDRLSKINTHKGLAPDMKAYFTLVS